ncbi:MAG: ptsK [Ignavibacteria bacterium]|nr:ptsK [Ignavibacteria bacterium]
MKFDKFDNLQVLQSDKILVEELMKSPCQLKPLLDVGMKNKITNKNLSRPQLALAGWVGLFSFDRVQIIGNTEHFFLRSLNNKQRIKAFKTILQFPIPCIVLTNGRTLEPELIKLASANNVAVLTTPYDTTKAMYLMSDFLEDQFASQVVVHGSFVDVYGVGILFIGKSGIGKSEVALDLVERGHRLVADDIVMLIKKGEAIIMGTGTSMVQHFMEIRGLGIIDIRQMFGIRSIRYQKRLEIIVRLEEWDDKADYNRTGLDEEPAAIMGVEIQSVRLPILPGKNITVIAEVIAINYLLRTYGYNAAKVFSDKLTDSISKRSGPKATFHGQRNITWLQSDKE